MMMFVGIPDIRRRNSRGSSILNLYLMGPVYMKEPYLPLKAEFHTSFFFKKTTEPSNGPRKHTKVKMS
jgi:hypothetical protein